MQLLSVIVPTYNSEKCIEELVHRLKSIEIDNVQKEIIIVDDGSIDQTWAKLQQLEGITVIHHSRNIGKGGAVRTGLQHAKGDILFIEDDDLEYDPYEIPRI